jgi:hypothetical protein
MVEYSKHLHQFFDVAEGFGIVTCGLTLLVVLVADCRPYPSFCIVTSRRFPPPWSVEELEACFVVKDNVEPIWSTSDSRTPAHGRPQCQREDLSG